MTKTETEVIKARTRVVTRVVPNAETRVVTRVVTALKTENHAVSSTKNMQVNSNTDSHFCTQTTLLG